MRRLLAVGALLLATNAAADTIWQKAQTPLKAGLLTTDELHRQVAKALFETRGVRVNDPIFGTQTLSPLEGALDKLDRHNAAASNDPRLRYDRGFVLARLLRNQLAASAFENAYSFAKDHPFAADALFELAICYSKLGKHAEEESAYLRALELVDRDSLRAMIYSNLAESRLAQGKLALGVEAAEIAIELDADSAAPRYNLALLRDRLGNSLGALEAAKVAAAYDSANDFLDGEGVFFEPAYEKYWYQALRELALAETSLGSDHTDHLKKALADYGLWLEASDPNDRYRQRCEENIDRLEKILKLKPQKK